MIGTLKRINRTDRGGTTRSEMVTGDFTHPPAPGREFYIFGDKKFDGSPGTRMWKTSEVTMVYEHDEKHIRFATKSGSAYELVLE